MSSTSSLKLICLFEGEIRIAARAMATLRHVGANEASTEEEVAQALSDAIDACGAALLGAEAEDALLVLTRLPR